MYGVVFLRVEARQLRVKQRRCPLDRVMPETVPQHINGLFNLLLYQQLLRCVIEQRQLHVFVGGHEINGGQTHTPQRPGPGVMLPEQFHSRFQNRRGSATGKLHFLLPGDGEQRIVPQKDLHAPAFHAAVP